MRPPVNYTLLRVLAAFFLLLADSAFAKLNRAVPAWQAVDPADPGFTYDQANIGKALYPISDAHGNQVGLPSPQLTAYIKVPVRTAPGKDGAAETAEEWAFDCSGNYAVLETTGYDATGKPIARSVINNRNGATGAPQEQLGFGVWGPEHFMAPVSRDPRAVKVAALACTPERTSRDPVKVTDIAEGHWTHNRQQGASNGWDAVHIVHARLGADEVTLKIDLFARPQGERPLDLQAARKAAQVGLSADFSRKLEFFPTGHYPWGYKAPCHIAVTASGLDSGWGFDSATPMFGRGTITARTPASERRLIDRISSGDYDLTVTCQDYSQPVEFHIGKPVPPRMIEDFYQAIDTLGGLTPPRTTQGL